MSDEYPSGFQANTRKGRTDDEPDMIPVLPHPKPGESTAEYKERVKSSVMEMVACLSIAVLTYSDDSRFRIEGDEEETKVIRDYAVHVAERSFDSMKAYSELAYMEEIAKSGSADLLDPNDSTIEEVLAALQELGFAVKGDDESS